LLGAANSGVFFRESIVEFKEEKNVRETIILFLVKMAAIGVDRLNGKSLIFTGWRYESLRMVTKKIMNLIMSHSPVTNHKDWKRSSVKSIIGCSRRFYKKGNWHSFYEYSQFFTMQNTITPKNISLNKCFSQCWNDLNYSSSLPI